MVQSVTTFVTPWALRKSRLSLHMKLGRPRKHAIDRLRAVAWYRSIVDAAEHESGKPMIDRRIAKVFKKRVGPVSLSNSANVAHYRRGDYRPGENTLRFVERVYPGTRRVFDDGPQFSYLWEALVGDPQRALVHIESAWRTNVPVELLMGVGGHVYGVVPRALANRLWLRHGARLALNDKRLRKTDQEGVALLISAGWLRAHARMPCATLTLAPPVTLTKKERLKNWGCVCLPPIAELGYRIAQAREQGLRLLTVESETRGLDLYGLSLADLAATSGFRFELDEGPEPYEEVLIEGVWRRRSAVV